MYISDIDKMNSSRLCRNAGKTPLTYLLISLFCALFGAIYELFSHGVYSFYMIYAFAFPLAGGTAPFLIMASVKVKRYPARISRHLYHSGIATFTAGSLVNGVLEIYGTTNFLTNGYWLVGIALSAAGIIAYLIQLRCRETDL